MPLINTSVPNLIQGVSQQPDAARHAGQCEEQVNALSSVVKGLTKRPPSVFQGNMYSTPDDTIDSEALKNAFIHHISRDDNENYTIIIDDGMLRIFRNEEVGSSTGGQCKITVNDVDEYTNGVPLVGDDYLRSSTSQQNIKAISVGDTTFLVNTAKAVGAGNQVAPDYLDYAIYFIKQADYRKTYNVIVDGTSHYVTTGDSDRTLSYTHSDYQTPNGSWATRSAEISGRINTQLNTSGLATTYIGRGIIGVSPMSGKTISVQDDLHGNGMGLVYQKAASINDLPKKAINGFVVKINGDLDLDQDDYYVKFEQDQGLGVGIGSWVETVGPNDSIRIGSNAPVQLLNTGVNEFKLSGMPLSPKKAGDSKSNPFPSFVGKSISNIFMYKNRLCFLSDDSVIFSEAGFGESANATAYYVEYDDNGTTKYDYPLYLDPSVVYGEHEEKSYSTLSGVTLYLPSNGGVEGSEQAPSGLTPFTSASSYAINKEIQSFNFFRTSVLSLLDSDPIDVGVSTKNVTKLKTAQAFNKDLIIFSDESQFVIDGGSLLTPSTIAVNEISSIDYKSTVEPLVLGSNMYFPFNRGVYSGINQYSPSPANESYEAHEITEHTPKYIPKNVTSFTGSNADGLIALTAGDVQTTAATTADVTAAIGSFSDTSVHSFVSGGSLIYHASVLNEDLWHYMEAGLRSADSSYVVHIHPNQNQAYSDIKAYDGGVSSGTVQRDSLTGYNGSLNENSALASTHHYPQRAGIPYTNYSNAGSNLTQISDRVQDGSLAGSWDSFKNKIDASDHHTVEFFAAFEDLHYNNNNHYNWDYPYTQARRLLKLGTYKNESDYHDIYIKMNRYAGNWWIGVNVVDYETNIYQRSRSSNGFFANHVLDPEPWTVGSDDDRMVHVFIIFNNSGFTVYLNNVRTAYYDLSRNGKNILHSIRQIGWGDAYVDWQYFRIYNRALNASERTANFNGRFN